MMIDKSKMIRGRQADGPNPVLTITDTGNGTAHLNVSGPVPRRVADRIAAVMREIRPRSGDLLPGEATSLGLPGHVR